MSELMALTSHDMSEIDSEGREVNDEPFVRTRHEVNIMNIEGQNPYEYNADSNKWKFR